MLLREAEVTYTARRIEGSAVVRTAADVWRICRDTEALTVERFLVLYLNTRHAVVARQVVSQGTVNSVEVHPREVFRGACMAGAAAVIVVHNHPSGDSSPSVEDRALTARLAKCGQLMGIPVLDHVVIGDGTYTSIAEVSPEVLSCP